jgi:dolichol-phosphate mannosyltransferase
MRFAASGIVAALVGAATVYMLTDIAGLWYVLSSLLSFIGASVVAFSLQKFWTFQERTMHRIPLQTTQTLALALFNIALNTALIYVLVDHVGLYYLFAQCLIYGIIGAIDFFAYKYVIFKN